MNAICHLYHMNASQKNFFVVCSVPRHELGRWEENEIKKRPCNAAAPKAKSSIKLTAQSSLYATPDVRMYASHRRIELLVDRFEKLGHV
jgi:hypothetical protein